MDRIDRRRMGENAIERRRMDVPLARRQRPYKNRKTVCPLPKVRLYPLSSSVLTLTPCAGKAAIIEEIRNNDVTVLIGETGSGKTTRKSVNG